jgi:transcriptional regulator GlxA family with amidase domain
MSISALASQFGMTTRSFNRRFKTATGLTPNQYLTKTRMDFVCDLLKTTDLPILEVANYAGFVDASWFSYRFRQWSGNSPSDYRQTVRAKLFN